MCYAAAIPQIIAAVVAAGSAYYSVDQNNRNIEAQNKALKKSAKYDYDMLRRREKEVSEQEAQEILQRRLQTSREHGMVMAAQGEAGVSGNSAVRILGNTLFQGAYDVNKIKTGAENQKAAIQDKMTEVSLGVQNGVNVNMTQAIGGFGAMTKIGGAAAEGYSSGSSMSSAWKSSTSSSSKKKLKPFVLSRSDGQH